MYSFKMKYPGQAVTGVQILDNKEEFFQYYPRLPRVVCADGTVRQVDSSIMCDTCHEYLPDGRVIVVGGAKVYCEHCAALLVFPYIKEPSRRKKDGN